MLADKLDMGHARALLALPPPAQQAIAAAKVAAEGRIGARRGRMRTRFICIGKTQSEARGNQGANGDLARLETEKLAEALGASVRIEPTRKGRRPARDPVFEPRSARRHIEETAVAASPGAAPRSARHLLMLAPRPPFADYI